jgi:hypothetical protein
MSINLIISKEKIEFANIREPKIIKLERLRDEALRRFKDRYGDDSEEIVLGLALKLSVSGSNVDRMVPLKIREHTIARDNFMSVIKPQRGQDVKEDEFTVSRFCACFASDISNYLNDHPDQVRTKIEGVPSRLSFPHNYYIKNLSSDDRDMCIAWLSNHDKIMSNVVKTGWRSVSKKAVAYFLANPL